MELSDVINKLVILLNNIFKNNYIRFVLLLCSSVFMGYTLQPVPQWLNNLFNTSNILKFLVLFISGCTTLYPIDKNNIVWIIFGSILTLVLFEYARYLDKN